MICFVYLQYLFKVNLNRIAKLHAYDKKENDIFVKIVLGM